MSADLAQVGPAEPAGDEVLGWRAGRGVRPLMTGSGVLAVLLGLALRLWTLGRAPINSDEAIVGLMAREILHGHFFAFYWGQSYGGVEPYVTAALFGVFGQSSFALSMTAVLLDAAAALLLWRVARRLFDGTVGVGAALLFWLWPEVYVHQSTIEYGFRWAALVLGLAMLLLCLRLAADAPAPTAPGAAGSPPRRTRRHVVADWVLLGGCVGLGWWATPEIVYYLLPSAALLGYAILRRGLRPAVLGVAGGAVAALVGALPWLWDNLGHGLPSLQHGPQGPGNGGFGHHLHVFAVYVLPMVLGLRERGSGAWLFDPPLAKALYLLAVLAGAGFLLACVLGRRAGALVVLCVLAPLIYAYSPFTWYWSDGRYAIFLAPAAAVVGAAALQRGAAAARLRGRPLLASPLLGRGAGAALAVLAGALLTLAAAARMQPYRASPGRSTATSWQADPNAYLAPTIAALERAGVRGVYAGYWVGYDLAFEARGRLVVSDLAYDRYRPYLEAVESSESTAWLFPAPARLSALEHDIATPLLAPGCIGGSACLGIGELRAYLRSTNDPFRTLRAGDFLAVLPRYPALAPEVYASAGIGY